MSHTIKYKEFHTTQEQFEGLHKDLDKTRATSKTVKVSREALQNILMDHADYAGLFGL